MQALVDVLQINLNSRAAPLSWNWKGSFLLSGKGLLSQIKQSRKKSFSSDFPVQSLLW